MTTDNIKILITLDASLYPALYGRLYGHKGSYVARLCFLIRFMASRSNAAFTDKAGREWFFISMRQMAAEAGGSLTTWNNFVHYCAAVGLLVILKPTKKTTSSAMKKSVTMAEKRKCKSVLWYHIPNYTPDILSAADETILSFNAQGINSSSLNKAAIIEALGQGAANHVYIDGRQKSRREKALERAIIEAIKNDIFQRGYTTKAIVMLEARKQIVSKRRMMKKAEAEKSFVRIWENRNKYLLFRAGASYHRPTKKEKQLYSLSGNGWIITAIE